ncbi:hypothetical protein NLX67_20140 [Domibacillus sp. A3M-37]|uniref:hypothetical protein n=1 Tax=Domibacillus sp. A3M-37 TaxID=2962037 RepID=UPI0020B80D0A|nr:hypothetical protein [Domibacillus sp. A3M-37]MCP3764654.1 hypothetical protein [Domibacillus sp. A3M-37]
METREETKTSRKKKLEELDITIFKLLPSAKPPMFHGYTIRNTVNRYFWGKKLRPFVLEQQGKKCSICGWTPEHETEMRHLHLHEIEEYDFSNKACHLIAIQLICRKCHSFQHIMRTELVSTKEQWKGLMQHFIRVNGCSSEIVKDFDLVIVKALELEGHKVERIRVRSLKEIYGLAEKPVRFTIHPSCRRIKKASRKERITA